MRVGRVITKADDYSSLLHFRFLTDLTFDAELLICLKKPCFTREGKNHYITRKVLSRKCGSCLLALRVPQRQPVRMILLVASILAA